MHNDERIVTGGGTVKWKANTGLQELTDGEQRAWPVEVLHENRRVPPLVTDMLNSEDCILIAVSRHPAPRAQHLTLASKRGGAGQILLCQLQSLSKDLQFILKKKKPKPAMNSCVQSMAMLLETWEREQQAMQVRSNHTHTDTNNRARQSR